MHPPSIRRWHVGGWYRGRPRIMQMGLAACAGGVGAVGQAPYDQPAALLLALSLAFAMARQHGNPRDAACIGWAFGAGYFGLSLIWILQPFQVDPDRYGWMAPFALMFLSAGLALFWGAAFWGARRLSHKTWPLAVTWAGAELVRAYIFTGFPWASPAQALVNGAAGQGLAWVGPHGMTLWLMVLAWGATVPARGWGWRAGQGAVLLGATIGMYLPPAAPGAALTAHVVRLVQPNAAQHLKWQPEFARMFFDRQLEFTAAPPQIGTRRPDLTVWPETAITWRYDDAGPALDMIRAAAAGGAVALGLLRQDNAVLFNSMVVLGAAGGQTQLYDKHHLVPFGEYIPLSAVADRLGLMGLAQTSGVGFQAGPGAATLDFGPLGRGIPLICYEAVFAHDVNAAPERADFLIQITNDAWFGHDAGPHQHLAQARMRAIEQGLPMMRAANTGVSAMIDPYGRVLAQLPMGVSGFVDAPLPQPLPPTIYSTMGDKYLILVLLVLAVGAYCTGLSSNKI
ncbi:apolipoprotein N-acyltransferase [Roseobacter sp.]|uniref:apolipoprotein N-acyltransferase n=1 Tax=Roseobacter sp. TaxID=1907202 RepID=UPI003297B8C7